MTYISELVEEKNEVITAEPVMALVDEFGQETPITEFDIRRTLKALSKVPENHHRDAYDELMERVYAARAIA